MPIVSRKNPQLPANPPAVQIAKPDYKSIQVDTRKHSKESIVAQIEGAPWTLKTYYSQVLNRDNAPAGQGLGTPAVVQQYEAIRGLEVRVTEPLDDSQVEGSKEMEQVGAANQYAFIIPNKGDMFTAELLDGREGIFEVTASTRPTIEADASYGMRYMLVGVDDAARIKDLENKTVKESFFEKDFIKHGQNPLLVSQDYEDVQFLRRQYIILVRRFFERYVSLEHATLILPEQPHAYYDHFLTKALYRMIDSSEDYRIRDVRRMNMNDDQLMDSRSVWDVLLERDRSLFNDIFTKVGLADKRSFDRFPKYDGIRFSGISMVIYPNDAVLRVDNRHTENPKTTAEFDPFALTPADSILKYLEKAKAEMPAPADGRALFPPLNKDGFYVFSRAFYENDRSTANSQSQLELCLQDLVDNKHLPFGRIRELVEYSVTLREIEHFYFVPAILILIRGVIRSI